MNEIQLGEAAVDVARIGADYLTPLNNLVQEAVDPVAQGRPSSGSPMAKDLCTQQREGNHGRMGLLAEFVLKHTITRSIAVMDALQGTRVLLAGVAEKDDRTGTAPAIMARSVFDAGASLAHHLHGALEERLLQAYASQLGDMQQALLAYSDQPEIVHSYTQLHSRAGALGFRLNTDKKKRTAGLPRVISISQGSRTANCEPNTTSAAKKHGIAPFAEQQWRYSSGITHARSWTLLGIQQLHENGAERGGAYLTALETAWHGAYIAIRALAAYTGNSSTGERLDNFSNALSATLVQGEHLPNPIPDAHNGPAAG